MPQPLSPEQIEARLERAGAGLPPVEAWMARHIIFPLTSPMASWDQYVRWMQVKGDTILADIRGLSPAKLAQRVLIKRFAGIEDSSRYWSVAMTLHHLCITQPGIANTAVLLAKRQQPSLVVRIEAVKPDPAIDAETTLAQFKQMLVDTPALLNDTTLDRQSPLTHQHPWFGPMTASQWVWLFAGHMAIHQRQVRLIKKGLT